MKSYFLAYIFTRIFLFSDKFRHFYSQRSAINHNCNVPLLISPKIRLIKGPTSKSTSNEPCDLINKDNRCTDFSVTFFFNVKTSLILVSSFFLTVLVY